MGSFEHFQKGLYNYYKEECSKEGKEPLEFTDFIDSVTDYKSREDKYLVYVGYSRNDKECSRIIYVGTTIQYPLSRFYYHKTHGKNFVFKEHSRFDNEKDMLALEYELIKKHHPRHNKITKREQNFNVPLTKEVLESRKGNPEWCQCCLTRRVSKGYTYCYFCSKL